MTPYTVARSLDNRQLRLIILPTEQCNFRCTYCYEDFALKKMSKTLEGGLIAFLNSRIPTLNNLHISWFGGEPLLAKDIVLNVSAHAKEQSILHGCIFSSDMTTNGSRLGSTLVDCLVDNNVTSYQITLDGVGQTHDDTRRRANGTGTFSSVLNGLEALRSCHHDINVNIRLHYTGNSLLSLPETVRWLRGEFLNDARFNLILHRIERWGGPNDADIVFPEPITEHAILQECREIIGKEGPTGPLEEDHVCYAAMANSLVVRSDGRLGKCTVALSDRRNDVGVLKHDGSLDIHVDRMKPWIEGLLKGEPGPSACPLAFLPDEHL